MFFLDSWMISGIRWTLDTVLTAAEAEMNDDTALREQLLEAELRREMGEISEADFASIEADLLRRIREIRERREGGGPIALAAQPMETTADSTFRVEADVSGDFHEPVDVPAPPDSRTARTTRTTRRIRTTRNPPTIRRK